ncbi:ABC transporter substrate-binding protein [Kocuria flava]|uniref:ABC transporter substrate-binding protein n=1 Tax=Kocuria flava TaxID=446860 RepID=A0A0U3HIA5_9MICC|nr:extracellular solute-binding protein [Kocuria flava]ALU40921.1 ABC transporter substrate-binding protein [Kocuria flava]GEO92206.1 trehalose-binding lipoprotein LpqY [Kocuria flava]
MTTTSHAQQARGRGRRGTAAALGAVGALVLTGCGGADAGGTPTLTWYINPDAGGQAELAQQCTEQSGGRYRIETSLLPRDAASQREQLARRLAAGDSSMDIMSLDPPFIPELAEPGFLAAPPQEVVDATTQDVLDGPLEGARWNDELVTIPFWANTQLLWYRESVAEAAGLDMDRPVTWQQIMDAARRQDKYLGVQGTQGESMTVWVNGLVKSAGGEIIENPEAPADEISVGLDSEAGRQAAEIVGTIGRDGLGGPGLPTSDENASMIQFQSEQGSFMVNWPFIYAATAAAVEDGTVEASVYEDIGWALWPRVDADTPSAPPLGGINLGVGATSEHQDLAWEAVECIVQPENQAHYFVTNGNPAASEAAYEDPEVREAYPMYATIRESLDQAAPRPQTPFYNEVSTAIQQEWTPPASVTESTPRNTAEFIEAVLRGDRLL